MQVERAHSEVLQENRLPDGSMVIVDPASETVFALNPTAGAAWDACSSPTTLSKVAEEMQRSFSPSVTEDLAAEAVLQLQDKKLVKTSGSSWATRRQLISTLSVAVLPLIVALPLAEQRAYAGTAKSAPRTTPIPISKNPPPPPPPPPPKPPKPPKP
jgi:hypothetical protein